MSHISLTAAQTRHSPSSDRGSGDTEGLLQLGHNPVPLGVMSPVQGRPSLLEW